MMKGAAGIVAGIIILLVVAVVGYYVLAGNGGIVFPTTSGYSNDVVKVQDLTLTNSQPLEGSRTTLTFLVRNSGDKTIDNVHIDFFDTPGFDKSAMRIQCGYDANEVSGSKCTLSNLEPLDSQLIQAIFLASPLPVESDQQFKIKYSVRYGYEAERDAIIPIVEDIQLLPSGTRFIQSSAPVSPIQVDIEPPIGLTRFENDREIVENFAREGKPFVLKFSFRDGTGRSPSTVEPVIFSRSGANELALSLDKFSYDTVGCDNLSEPSGRPDKDLQVPFSVECSLVSTDVSSGIEPFVLGKVTISYSFEYKFSGEIPVTVKKLRSFSDGQ